MAGAIHSGLAMVLTLLIPLRRIFGFEKFITMETLESIAKTIIFTGPDRGVCLRRRVFHGLVQRQHRRKRDTFIWRAIGHYACALLDHGASAMPSCPSPFSSRRSAPASASLFVISILINIGMWYERFVIIVGSMAHEYNPYSWGNYSPTWVELGIMVGSFCLFLFLFFLFVKFLPSISITEIKESLRPPMRERSKA